MRISDWSSDVCSSDLDRDTDDDRDERACVDATCQPPEARRNQRKDRNDAQEPVAQQTEDRIAEALQIGLCERWFGCDERCQRHRSEEHTSELQSLMRISYAVFCLKKKKTTHQ